MGKKVDGTLAVPRIKGSEGFLMVLLVDVRAGCILESSRGLTEPGVRKLLADKYGKPESQIEKRLELAKNHPEI